MQKVKIYAWVIYRILVFYAKRHIYFKLDEFASPGIQGRHLCEKRKVKEELNKYIEESIAKDFGR